MPLCRFEVRNLLPFSGTESSCGKHLALYTDGRLRYFTFVIRVNLVCVSMSCGRSRRSSAEERGICNPQVVGSNPTGGSTLLPPIANLRLLLCLSHAFLFAAVTRGSKQVFDLNQSNGGSRKRKASKICHSR